MSLSMPAISLAALPGRRKTILDIAQQAEARGFQGRLIVMGEPDVAPGDVRVEWADGGIVRCQADIEDALQEIVDRFAAARREGIEEAAE